jgi:hypothetical protein
MTNCAALREWRGHACLVLALFAMIEVGVILSMWSWRSSARVGVCDPLAPSSSSSPGSSMSSQGGTGSATSSAPAPAKRAPPDPHQRQCTVWSAEQSDAHLLRSGVVQPETMFPGARLLAPAAAKQASVYCVPTLYLVGMPKTGSTTLYDWLLQHPQLRSAFYKEPGFWNRPEYSPDFSATHFYERIGPLGPANATHTPVSRALYGGGEAGDAREYQLRLQEVAPGWYDDPLSLRRAAEYPARRALPHHQIDATVTYGICGQVARRLRTHVPNARVVLLVRAPVARFVSHYRMLKAHGAFEARTLAQAVRDNLQAAAVCRRRFAADDERWRWCMSDEAVACWWSGSAVDPAPRAANYLTHGLYDRIYDMWVQPHGAFPTDQVLLLSAEHVWADPLAAVRKVWHFYGLHTPPNITHWNLHFPLTTTPPDRSRVHSSMYASAEERAEITRNLTRFYAEPMRRFALQTGIQYLATDAPTPTKLPASPPDPTPNKP